MAGFGERLQLLRTDRGWSQGDVARSVGTGRSTISGYEAGISTPTYRILVSLAKLFDVSLDYLTDQLPKGAIPVDKAGMVALPVYGPVQAGKVGIVEDVPEEGRRLIDAALVEGGKHFWLLVEGDCMAPRLRHGDYVLIRMQSEVENGEVAAVVMIDSDEATLKRYFVRGRDVVLQPTNPNDEPIITDARNVRVVGKAVLGQIAL
jgi:repressor LexA